MKHVLSQMFSYMKLPSLSNISKLMLLRLLHKMMMCQPCRCKSLHMMKSGYNPKVKDTVDKEVIHLNEC